MTLEQQLVKEFFQVMQQNVRVIPEIPPFEERKLRARLILEEALETVKALGFEVEIDAYGKLVPFYEEYFPEPNLIDIADGLADLHYVGYCGTGLSCGISMDSVFDEVHRSNMSKLWSDSEKYCYNNRHVSYEKYPDDLQFSIAGPTNTLIRTWLAKDKTGKVIKSPSYSPADIKGVIERQQLKDLE